MMPSRRRSIIDRGLEPFDGFHRSLYNTPMPAKKQFYAVIKGRRPGIYTRWTGEGGAEEQIKGFAGAVFRGFATRSEAEQYLRTGKVLPAPALPPETSLPGLEPFTQPAAPAQPAARAAGIGAIDPRADLEAGSIVIFTDGASTGNPGPGGYGVVLLFQKKRRELSGGFRCTTNNRMELMGVITALRALSASGYGDGNLPPSAVTPKLVVPPGVVLYSDSRYVINAVNLGWARRWRARGWMRDATNRAENADLWAALLDLLDRRAVEFRWVRGHASSPENERCDRLAVAASRKKNLPPDPGFTGSCA